MNKPLIIFDTDMDTDCDDAGALALLYEYVCRDKAELLGIVTDSVNPYAAPCCEYMGHFYGIERPVGAVSSSLYPERETDRLVRYRKHSAAHSRYNQQISAPIGKTDADYPTEVQMYRQLLSQSPDKSVTIVCVGLLTALTNALLSEPDTYSDLTGVQLFAQKVDHIVSMGYPAKTGPNFNWHMDGESSRIFFEICPVPVYASGYGTDIVTGSSLTSSLPIEHPLRQIYELYTKKEHTGRSSWDLIATLYAVDPSNPLLKTVKHGSCRFDPSCSRSYWEPKGPRMDYEIILNTTNEILTDFLEKRMKGDFS